MYAMEGRDSTVWDISVRSPEELHMQSFKYRLKAKKDHPQQQGETSTEILRNQTVPDRPSSEIMAVVAQKSPQN